MRKTTLVECPATAAMESPSLVFPVRRVGCLEVGCEASFIAFTGNPLEDAQQLGNIVLRVKDGQERASESSNYK